MKRGPPVSVLRLYLSTVLQQQFSHRQVAISRGNMELRETVISLDKMNQSRFFLIFFFKYNATLSHQRCTIIIPGI